MDTVLKSIRRHMILTSTMLGFGSLSMSAFGGTDQVLHGGLPQFADGVQPGCAMGIFGPAEKKQYRSGGYAQLSSTNRLDENTQFLAASMSKQFTALAILVLVDEGKLKLGDQAREWVPELAGAVGDATIGELLHHTAGVRDHVNLLFLAGVEILKDVDRPETLALMARQRRTNFAPGTRSQYSNGNYFVLAEIVRRVSDEALETFAADKIFAPARMSRTYFLGGADPVALADGYQPRGKEPGFREANDRPATNGSGGLVTTVADLSRFEHSFRTGTAPWNPRIKALFFTPGTLRSGEVAILPEFGTPYGMGVGLARVGDDLQISHDGGAEGFRSEYVRMRDAPIGVAVLCNRVDADASAMAVEALEIARGASPPPPAPQASAPADPKVRPERPDPSLIRAVAGNYGADELDAVFNIAPIEDGFEVKIRSPFIQTKNYSETWGGVTLDGPNILRSGPLKIELDRHADRISIVALSFGHRAEGIALKRLDADAK